jgi:hypothetical protein
MAKLVLVLAALLVVATALDAPSAKAAKGAKKHKNHDNGAQALVQTKSAEGAQAVVSDETVVETKFGAQTVNEQNLKAFLSDRQVSDIGLIDDLIVRAACVIRLEEETVVEPISTAALQDYCTSRELSTTGSKDQLLDRGCNYQSKELIVVNLAGKPIGDITSGELKSMLVELGFVSTSGSKVELVARLGESHKNINTIRSLLNDQTFEATQVKDILASHSLPVDGTVDVLLARLADHLVMQAQNTLMPGISEHCDLVVETGICMMGGRKVLAGDAVPAGLVGRWTFDDAHGLDSSGGRHHAKEVTAFGPGVNGIGQSAHFDGTSMIEIPHTDKLTDTKDFCLTMWVYLLTDSTGQWRTLVHKGERDHERTPTIFLEPQTRGIEFFVSTTDDSQAAGERVWSNTFLPMRRWTHIAACAEDRNLRLYINGILDAENTTVGTPIMNAGPMYIGNDPWRPSGGTNGYVDEVKYYSRLLMTDEIQAEAATALGICEPAFAELGCMGCSIDNCPKTCRQGYRMCTDRDHHMCGYHIARSMGWASTDTRIWKAEDGKATDISAGESGLCVCCKIGEE